MPHSRYLHRSYTPLIKSKSLIIVAVLLIGATSPGNLPASAFQTAANNERASVSAVSGTVSVAGKHQALKPLPVFKNRSFCGSQVSDETLLVGARGGLRNAVVAFYPLERKSAALPMQLVLDNKNCAFTPHVVVATPGSDLLLKNSDPILHTVHARMGGKTLFNIGLPKWRQVTKRLDQAGLIKIDCDVLHTWMSAVILVVQTPYFAVSDANGKFVVDRLPPGLYQVDIWHEKLGMKSIRVAVDSDLLLDVVYASNGKFRGRGRERAG